MRRLRTQAVVRYKGCYVNCVFSRYSLRVGGVRSRLHLDGAQNGHD